VESVAASGAEDEPDPAQESKAMNSVVFLMMGMPYLLLGATGFLVYHGLKKMARVDQPAVGLPDPRGKEHLPCSLPSTDGPS
jgi:hypothetical protein